MTTIRRGFTRECPDCGEEIQTNHLGQTLHRCDTGGGDADE